MEYSNIINRKSYIHGVCLWKTQIVELSGGSHSHSTKIQVPVKEVSQATPKAPKLLLLQGITCFSVFGQPFWQIHGYLLYTAFCCPKKTADFGMFLPFFSSDNPVWFKTNWPPSWRMQLIHKNLQLTRLHLDL